MGFLSTFAEYLASQGLPEDPSFTADDQLAVRWAQYDQAVWQLVNEIGADPIAGASLRALLDVISEDIIDSHLGDGWFAVHVDGSSRSKQARNYLRSEGPPERRLLSAHRVHELARRLYELHSFPGSSR